jgi:hypothetical protein
MKYYLIILITFFLLQSCIPSRTILRPKLTGYVFNEDSKEPIDSCNVVGTYTNSKGYYKIKKISYIEFVPLLGCPTHQKIKFGNEIFLSKNGFKNDTVNIKSINEIGTSKKNHVKLDTIFLLVEN